MLDGDFKEVGSAVQTGTFGGLFAVVDTNDFGARAGNSFLTGVAYTDAVSANTFYDVGEGLGGLSVVVTNASGATTRTTTNAAGGYQIQLAPGTYTVTFSGTGVTTPITKTFTIGSLNVEVDLNTRIDKFTGGPPALSGTNPANYFQNSAPVAIDSSIVITDAGRTSLATATITISNFVAGQDVLGFVPNATTMGNIAVSSNANGVLNLSSAGATATLAQWQTALRAVTYSNTSNSPSSVTRNVTFSVDDGKATNHLSNAMPTTISITDINHAPVGTPNTVTTLEDTPYVFKAADFGFADRTDVPANSLLAVKIASLPLLGTLTDSGVTIAAGTIAVGAIIPVADITAGRFKFTPASNGNGLAYSSFTFQVEDNGGTVHGGIDTDPTARKMTIAVTPG